MPRCEKPAFTTVAVRVAVATPTWLIGLWQTIVVLGAALFPLVVRHEMLEARDVAQARARLNPFQALRRDVLIACAAEEDERVPGFSIDLSKDLCLVAPSAYL